MPFKSQAQQRYMFATQPKTAEKWAHETPNINKLPQHVEEVGMDLGQDMQSWEHPGCEDTVGDVYVVLKPSPESSPETTVHKTHAFGIGQFDPSTVHGVYNDSNEANLVAESSHADLHKHLRKMEKKKDQVLDEITKHINRFQKEVNSHMQEATEKPEEADMHHDLAQRKMDRIRGLRDKHKAVKSTKKELPEPKENKK